MTTTHDRLAAEDRFRSVFSHLGAVATYARRRGHPDADAAAAEVMTIAWRRLADVPRDDPRPWLFATARNIVLADRRRTRTVSAPVAVASETEVLELDPELESALRALSYADREALLSRAQLQNERTLVGLYGDRLTATVALVKALGGGWRSSEAPS